MVNFGRAASRRPRTLPILPARGSAYGASRSSPSGRKGHARPRSTCHTPERSGLGSGFPGRFAASARAGATNRDCKIFVRKLTLRLAGSASRAWDRAAKAIAPGERKGAHSDAALTDGDGSALCALAAQARKANAGSDTACCYVLPRALRRGGSRPKGVRRYS
jgi:hypothetical protein